jgi:cell division protein FtsA
MKASEIIVGLDIGTTKIAVIIGRRNEHGKIEILGSGKSESLGVKRGVVSNIDYTVQSIVEAVKEAEAKSNVGVKYVHVGIAGQHIKSIQQKGSIIRQNVDDEISSEDIERLINNMRNIAMNPGEEIIDVIPQDFTIDNEQGIKEPIGMLGHSLEANCHIITGLTAAAKNIYKCVTKPGLKVSELILEPLASSRSVLSEEEKEAGVVLVDIGGGTTDVAIFQDGIIRHTAVIPFGGDIITEDVKVGCTIIKKHAEDLKVKFGSALASENKDEEIVAIPGLRGRPPKEISLKNLAHIIQARMEEIIEHVYYEIKRSGYEKKLIAGIVLTGGGAQMKHAAQLCEFVTGMDTRIGYPTEHLANNTPEEIAAPMYATGVGLVIEGLDRFEKSNIAQANTEMLGDRPEDGEDNDESENSEEDISHEEHQDKSKIGDGFLKRIQKFFEEDELN